MSQTARHCPHCGQLNYGKAVFCQTCGEDISSEPTHFVPWAQSHLLPPMAQAAREEGRRFAHLDPEAAGSGLVWGGLVVIATGLVLDMPVQTLAIFVGIGAAIVISGLWQLRIDYSALSRLDFG